jgi:hypothetical protein
VQGGRGHGGGTGGPRIGHHNSNVRRGPTGVKHFSV